MASFPTSIFSPTTKSAGQTIQPGHVNDVQDEVVAMETALLTWTSYVPTWGNTGTANTLGNGTISGSYIALGDVIIARITLIWGTTTASGNGAWTFTLPAASAALITAAGGNGEIVGYGLARDASAGVYTVSVALNSTTVIVPLNADAISTGIGATTPFAWTSTDSMSLMVIYDKG